jgi:putative transposase
VVKAAAKYAWSSAKAHILGTRDPVLSNSRWFLEEIGVQHYRSYLEEEESEKELGVIRRMTKQGLPLGISTFQQKIEQALKRKLIPRPRGRPRKKASSEK